MKIPSHIKFHVKDIAIIVTHDFDWEHPFDCSVLYGGVSRESVKVLYQDFQCKKCNSIILQLTDRETYVFEHNDTLACNEMIMKDIIE